MNNTPTTVGENAQLPRQIERRGGKTVPYTRKYPEVRGGQCEFCGTLDPNVPAIYQYKLCPHFRNMGELQCSYCDATKDPNDVVGRSKLNIYDHPYKRDAYGNPELVVVCDSYECSQKHRARFEAGA